MPIHDPNADRERIAATQTAREHAQNLASVAANHLREITTACSGDGETFARLQTTPQNLSAAIIRLVSVARIVDELEGLLPEIVADWSAN